MGAWLELSILVTTIFLSAALPNDVPLNLFIGTGTIKVVTTPYCIQYLVLSKEVKAMELDRSLPGFKYRSE